MFSGLSCCAARFLAEFTDGTSCFWTTHKSLKDPSCWDAGVRALSMLLLRKPFMLESQLLFLPSGSAELYRRSPGEPGPSSSRAAEAGGRSSLPSCARKRSYGLLLGVGDSAPPCAASGVGPSMDDVTGSLRSLPIQRPLRRASAPGTVADVDEKVMGCYRCAVAPMNDKLIISPKSALNLHGTLSRSLKSHSDLDFGL